MSDKYESDDELLDLLESIGNSSKSTIMEYLINDSSSNNNYDSFFILKRDDGDG